VAKHINEIRDPIHVFIRIESEELEALDSPPLQRLRDIHQLGLTYLLYPGATHKRFEHSLGVMELASRVFDIITRPENVHDRVKNIIPPDDKLRYWRHVLRMAALFHDVGHLPFSHGAEDLLPEGWTHERLTAEIIRSSAMQKLWSEMMTPPLRVEDIVKLAVGQKDLSKFGKNVVYNEWESILSEIIAGDAFGVDRMDYLLRDSHHIGVAYGKFDHYRLIDTLRILPKPELGSSEPTLGIEEGGLHSAEALHFARYFMFTQVYFHRVRRIYDIHLKDFLKSYLDEGRFSKSIYNQETDSKITVELLAASKDKTHPGHEAANCITNHAHFKFLYEQNPNDIPKSSKFIFKEACNQFGVENVKYDKSPPKGGIIDFPVLKKDDRIESAQASSDVLKKLPPVSAEFVFIHPDLEDKGKEWRDKNREQIIASSLQDEDL